ncbi:MAG: septation regulator SpoVG [Lachnospiraceae bacterium]|nr:septation regulator SpoVG [Lachnospiraceae bacterium]
MQITDIRIRKMEKESKMKAVVSVTFDDEFVVHDIKIIDGDKGLFIAMPSRKGTDGDYKDIAHPIRSNVREKLQEMILKKYEEEFPEGAGTSTEA